MPIPKPPTDDDLRSHPVVSREEWLAARKLHLRNEKALMDWVRRHDEYPAPEGAKNS